MPRFPLDVRLLIALAPLACSGSSSCSSSCASSSSSSSSAGSAAPSGTPPAGSVAAEAPGPVVSIPAGTLVAGTACGDQPRLPSAEPAGVPVDLQAFTIDAYPYPNDAQKPPLVGVSQAEAKAMCLARGRRLCTELEWERACKGPSNARYEYGSRFDAKRCSTALGTVKNAGPVGALEQCKSEFGVHAMHGFAFEWTSSAWGRGEDSGRAVLRGGFGNQPFAHMRCSAAKASAPDAKDPSVGFRCCGGPENSAKVDIAKDERPVLEPLASIDPELSTRLQGALKHGGLKSEEGAYAIDKAWRWHPVPNEELTIARVTDQKAATPTVILAIVLLCDRISQLSNKVSGPLDDVGEPASKTEPVRGGEPDDLRRLLVFPVKAGSDSGEIRLEYQFGQVAMTPPPWLKQSGAK